MRLLQKINRDYLISSAIIMVIGLITFYFLLRYISSSEIEEGLKASIKRIEQQISTQHSFPNLYPIINIKEAKHPFQTILKDTSIYDPVEGETEVFKELSEYKKINGKGFQITVRTLIMERKDIMMSIFLGITLIFILLVLTLYFINKKVAKSIWKPFYQNLQLLKSFSLKEQKKLKFPSTSITEFQELNHQLEQLTYQVTSDYNSLKEFTSNAAHELQTPLAIIQAKAENMLNGTPLPEEHLRVLQSILEGINRLNRLNKTLLLLTKIENTQFSNKEAVSFNKIIKDTMASISELFTLKNLTPDLQINGNFTAIMDKTLAELLVSNLIKNQLMHTHENGKISIEIDNDWVIFKNEGENSLNKEKIYDRFYKESKAEQSTGLGLALVKKICDVSDLNIEYEFHNKTHKFTISKFSS